MTSRDILTGARSMWELVDRRAAASPGHPMLIAPSGETVTFGSFRDRAEHLVALRRAERHGNPGKEP